MSLQMTCPYCKREFPYDNNSLDYRIHKIGHRLFEINQRLTEIKSADRRYQKNEKTVKERNELVKEKAELDKRLFELKSFRKTADQQIKYIENMLLREIIKERFGEEEYKKVLDQLDLELQAYNASGLMAHEYSKAARKKAVTSINKL